MLRTTFYFHKYCIKQMQLWKVNNKYPNEIYIKY
jgi:hypothetical protein